jgi:hypothetical protein
MDLFKKKPTMKEQIKTNDRELRKVDRDVERDRNKLEREEKKLELEIKKAAKAGNKQATTVLAKQLIQMRKQKNPNFYSTKSNSWCQKSSPCHGSQCQISRNNGPNDKSHGTDEQNC